ncbi:MAG: ABC transporter permease subunit [Bacteroidia bacterium]
MGQILKYTLFDLLRNRWTLLYAAFYLVLTTGLFWLSGDTSQVLISLMNIVLLLAPLVATMFSITYYYHARDFVELLLAQPLRRTQIFMGQYLGIASSLALGLLVGLGLPLLLFGVGAVAADFATLLLSGMLLSFVFAGVAFFIALHHDNRIKGFGLALLVWLFFAVIYDGVVLLIMATLGDYPLDRFAVGASVLNPIDLSRLLVLLKLDISALMGYAGAIFRQFVGSGPGMVLAAACLLAWAVLPLWGIRHRALRRDF